MSDALTFAGIDRRTVGPALLVLALAVMMAVVLPLIDSRTAYRDPIHKGEIAELADGITLVPTAGWDLAEGAVLGETRSQVGDSATTELVHGSVTFGVHAAPFSGTPSALLSRVNEISAKLHHARGSATATRRYVVRTRQGAVGVAENFLGVNKAGTVVAFVLRPGQRITGLAGQSTNEGVEVVVSGPRGPLSRRRDEIIAMIRSIRTHP